MPVERDKLTTILRTVPVDYFGEKLSVIYKPDVMTPASAAEYARLRAQLIEERNGDGERDANAIETELLVERLAGVMVSWEVTEKGEPLPPTKENLMTFPNALLGHILVAITDDLAPKAKTSRR